MSKYLYVEVYDATGDGITPEKGAIKTFPNLFLKIDSIYSKPDGINQDLTLDKNLLIPHKL